MAWSSRSALALGAVSAALLAIAGCGGGDSIVQIHAARGASIDRPMLDHWMRTLVGGDFRRTIGTEGPDGLASEPADPRRCFAAAKLVGPRSFFNQLRLTRPQVETTCRELHSAVKAQALSFLIAVQWTVAEGASRGVGVSDAEVEHALGQLKARLAASRHQLREYLAERHSSLADLRYRLKAEVLAAKIEPQAAKRLNELGDGEAVEIGPIAQHRRDLVAKTKCSPRYVVPGCSEYHASVSRPTPDVILRALVGNAR